MTSLYIIYLCVCVCKSNSKINLFGHSAPLQFTRWIWVANWTECQGDRASAGRNFPCCSFTGLNDRIYLYNDLLQTGEKHVSGQQTGLTSARLCSCNVLAFHVFASIMSLLDISSVNWRNYASIIVQNPCGKMKWTSSFARNPPTYFHYRSSQICQPPSFIRAFILGWQEAVTDV